MNNTAKTVIPMTDKQTQPEQRKRPARPTLRDSELRYRRLFETAQDGILILDANTAQILDVNPFFVEMLGYSREQCLGKKLWEIGAFKDEAACRSAFFEVQAQGYIRYENLPLETRDGASIGIEFVSRVYPVDGQKVIQCNIRDITARIRAEAQVLTLNAELERRVQERTTQLQVLNQELETFNYSVSHDLCAPLRRIKGFAEALHEDHAGKLDAEGVDFIRRIRASAQHMDVLIDALLRLSRFSGGQLYPQPTNLSMLVHSIAAELQQDGSTRQVEVVVAEGVTATGDPALLRVLLENLLGNAWKFTNQKTTARIEFGSMPQTDKTVTYFVADDGAGFNMKYSSRLFGAFQRFHHQDEFPGTGIGLASVQRIVHRHGGQVWAQSTVGQGATFYFTLGDLPECAPSMLN